MLNGLKKHISRRATPLLVATMLLMNVSALTTTAWASPSAQTPGDMEHLAGMSGQKFETHWMSMMIQHHEGAIMMAELVPDRANHAELKALAQEIIAMQSQEIEQMTMWLKQWYNTEPMEGMMHGDMHMMERLARLSGDAFDKEFLIMMHHHHVGAVKMAELVPDRATHEELKTLAANIIEAQEAEMMMFTEWLMSWYNYDITLPAQGGQPGMPRTGVPAVGTLFGLIVAALALIAGGTRILKQNKVRR